MVSPVPRSIPFAQDSRAVSPGSSSFARRSAVSLVAEVGTPKRISGWSFAAEKSVPFLGAVPLNIDIRLSGDEGAPLVAARPDAPEAQVFHDMAKRLIEGGVL